MTEEEREMLEDCWAFTIAQSVLTQALAARVYRDEKHKTNAIEYDRREGYAKLDRSLGDDPAAARIKAHLDMLLDDHLPPISRKRRQPG